MKFAVGLDEQEPDNILPPDKRVYIIFETQEEINKMYALLNHRHIARAIHIHDNNWGQLKLILPRSHGYEMWHDKLCKKIIKGD